MLVDILLKILLFTMPHVDCRGGIGTRSYQIRMIRDPLAFLDRRRCIYLESWHLLVCIIQIPDLNISVNRSRNDHVFIGRVPVKVVDCFQMSINCLQGNVLSSQIPYVHLPILASRSKYRVPSWIKLYALNRIACSPDSLKRLNASSYVDIPKLNL